MLHRETVALIACVVALAGCATAGPDGADVATASATVQGPTETDDLKTALSVMAGPQESVGSPDAGAAGQSAQPSLPVAASSAWPQGSASPLPPAPVGEVVSASVGQEVQTQVVQTHDLLNSPAPIRPGYSAADVASVRAGVLPSAPPQPRHIVQITGDGATAIGAPVQVPTQPGVAPQAPATAVRAPVSLKKRF